MLLSGLYSYIVFGRYLIQAQTGYRYIFIFCFPQSLQTSAVQLKLGHYHILPHPFKFIIHKSSYNLMLYDLSYWKHF
jgi:hypothetical protein